jgi:hypothetical protein
MKRNERQREKRNGVNYPSCKHRWDIIHTHENRGLQFTETLHIKECVLCRAVGTTYKVSEETTWREMQEWFRKYTDYLGTRTGRQPRERLK